MRGNSKLIGRFKCTKNVARRGSPQEEAQQNATGDVAKA